MKKHKKKNDEFEVDQYKKYVANSFYEVLQLLKRGIPLDQIESKGGLQDIEHY